MRTVRGTLARSRCHCHPQHPHQHPSHTYRGASWRKNATDSMPRIGQSTPTRFRCPCRPQQPESGPPRNFFEDGDYFGDHAPPKPVTRMPINRKTITLTSDDLIDLHLLLRKIVPTRQDRTVGTGCAQPHPARPAAKHLQDLPQAICSQLRRGHVRRAGQVGESVLDQLRPDDAAGSIGLSDCHDRYTSREVISKVL